MLLKTMPMVNFWWLKDETLVAAAVVDTKEQYFCFYCYCFYFTYLYCSVLDDRNLIERRIVDNHEHKRTRQGHNKREEIEGEGKTKGKTNKKTQGHNGLFSL